MKTFKVNAKVPIQVSWEQELVEDKSNFYIRLSPRVNTSGVSGAPRLIRVTTASGEARYMTLKHFNYQQKVLENAKKKAIEAAKEDESLKKALVAGAKGIKGSTPVSSTSRISSTITREDIEAGRGLHAEQASRDAKAAREEARKLAEKDEFAKQLLYGRTDEVE